MDVTKVYACSDGPYLRRWSEVARRWAAFRPWLRFSAAEPGRVTGVFELTRLDGRQYSVLSLELPHERPVRVFFHFSAPHRLRLLPFSVFRTCPLFFRHFAMA